jgi:hypothetical protein
MSATDRTLTYRTLLRAPGAAAFFLAAAAGRGGIAMTGLGIVWLVHARTGSYAAAGLVSGGFAVAEAVAGPQLARLTDRFGQARVLRPVLLAHAAAVATLLALVAAGAPQWLMTAGGALAGATIPQLGALSAARWAALLRGERAAALPTAFTLEALANELAYLVGPALVSVIGATGRPALGTALAGALVVSGGLCFAAQRRTAPPASGAAATRRTGRLLLRPGFTVLVGVNLAIGVFFGAMQVSVTAFAVEHGMAGAAAPLFMVSSCASLLAGWLYGLRRWRTAPRVQLAVAAAWLAAGCLPLLVAGSPVELGVGIALTGLVIPPLLVLGPVLAELSVDRAVLTQAFVWLNSASAAGSAGAAAVAGWAVGAHGAHGGFAVAAAAGGAMAVLAVTGLAVTGLAVTGLPATGRAVTGRVALRPWDLGAARGRSRQRLLKPGEEAGQGIALRCAERADQLGLVIEQLAYGGLDQLVAGRGEPDGDGPPGGGRRGPLHQPGPLGAGDAL